VNLTDRDIEQLNEAKKLIDKDTSKHYSIPEIAREVGLSKTRLTRGFKQLFNSGLFEFLENARLEKAKELLANTNKTLKQISVDLGYKYSNNFSTAFKRKYGRTPRSWKKNPDVGNDI
jgi:AraC family transcriptional activator of pyochelin receptor